MALINVSQLRKGLKTTPEQDEDLALERDAVVELWEQQTRRLWERRVGHIYQTTPIALRQSIIWLPLWPVEVITQVEVISKTLGTGAFVVLDADNYRLEGDNKIRLEGGASWWRYDEVKVTFTGGYTVGATGIQTETPKDITKALIKQVEFERRRMSNEHLDIRSQNFEGGSGVFLKPDLHPYFRKRARLRMHKRPG